MKYEESIVDLEFLDVELSESGNELYFSGLALETGVWTDSHGTTLYYPIDVIHKSSHLFIGAPVLCMHKAGTVGKIIDVTNTEQGMRIKGVTSHAETIALVLSKKLRGLSVSMIMLTNPVKRMLIEVITAREISLVDNPACKVCVLDQSFTLDDQGDIVSEDIEHVEQSSIEDEQSSNMKGLSPDAGNTPDEYPMPNCDEYKDDAVKYDECQKFTQSVSLFAKAQNMWQSFLHTVKNTDIKYEETNMAEAKPTEDINPEVEIENGELSSETTEVEIETEVVIEVEQGAETITDADETVVVTDVEQSTEVVEEVIDTVNVELTAKLTEVEETLSTTEIELADKSAKLIDTEIKYASTLAELSIMKAQLKAVEDAKRTVLVESVMKVDPNTDINVISEMSDVQLEAYKETIQRLSKPSVGEVRKSKNTTEKTVELSKTTVENPEDLTNNVIEFLRTKQ